LYGACELAANTAKLKGRLFHEIRALDAVYFLVLRPLALLTFDDRWWDVGSTPPQGLNAITDVALTPQRWLGEVSRKPFS
jgi:hypothetical protein